MKIPKEFKLFGSTIKVVFDDKKCSEHESLGIVVYRKNTIYLKRSDDGVPISKTEIECTYLHEVVHLILQRTEFRELNKNEQLVDLISRSLHQILETQIFDKKK